MFIQLDPNSPQQLNRQLSDQLIQLIAKGELKLGDTLPSVRSLAADLGIHVSTVSKSYHELEQKGLIELKPKAKAKIIVGSQLKEETEQQIEQVEHALTPIMAEAVALGMNKEQMSNLFERILKKWR